MKTNKLIVLGGPTAIGKTNLSIILAKKFKSEIISADARQFYQELNIGVAKPSKSQLNLVPHHFISHLSILNNYSVGQYEKDGLELLNNLFKNNNILFLCGGSGLYIDAICEGLNEFPKIDQKIKHQLNQELKVKGIDFLNKELKSIDSETYRVIDKNNHRRVIRALEVYRTSGVPYSYYTKQNKKKRNFKILFISLVEDREILYKQINKRVDLMIKEGLINEVKSLYEHRNKQALNTIGYQELFRFINQEISIQEAINEIKKNTRRYAKRQINWFSKKKYHQHKVKQKDEIINLIKGFISDKN